MGGERTSSTRGFNRPRRRGYHRLRRSPIEARLGIRTSRYADRLWPAHHAGGRLFFGSADRTIYSLNARTGCVYWTFKAPTTVRSPITLGPLGNGFAAYFGDGQSNAYAVDAQSGELIWKVKVDEHKLSGITGGMRLYEAASMSPFDRAQRR